jgi:hypothetical protein
MSRRTVCSRPGEGSDFLLPLAPQRHAAKQPGFVGDDLDILPGLEVDFLGIASAEVKVIPVEEFGCLFDRFL